MNVRKIFLSFESVFSGQPLLLQGEACFPFRPAFRPSRKRLSIEEQKPEAKIKQPASGTKQLHS